MTRQNPLDVLTIIIPTYNRSDLLRRALAGYIQQSEPNQIGKLIVVDDGSNDDTRRVVTEFQKVAPFETRYLHQSNYGPATARNLGMANAATPLVLFTDDDIIPNRDLVAQHLEWHGQNPDSRVAILGHITWSPEVQATPFMRWYGEAGPLFAYRQFRHKRKIDFRFFYSCNLSLKRDFLQANGGFDERFKLAAYEDTELGFRLSGAGLQLLYNPRAIAYHYQHFTFADACRKKRQAESARQLFLQTEAGKRLLEIQSRRDSSLSFRVARKIATWIGSVLQPVPKVIDSRFPLPGMIYRSLFWYHAGRFADAPRSVEQSPSQS